MSLPRCLGCCVCCLAVILSIPVVAQQDTAEAVAQLSPADREFYQRLARRIEPEMQGDPSRLEQYIWFYAKELANDVRLFAFDVAAHAAAADSRVVRLSGYVEFPEHRQAVASLLRVLGFEIAENNIALLPDSQLEDRRFGLLLAAHSPSYDRPTGARAVVTECLFGEPLFLLRHTDQHYLCHSSDGYLGYVASSDVRPVNQQEFAEYLTGDRVVVCKSHDVGGQLVPVGANLRLVKADGAHLRVQFPDGANWLMSPDDCRVQPALEPAVEQVIETGKTFLGTKYLWGGKSHEGIDCSGLVQVSFRTAGYHLPRDSNQQFLMGKLAATRWCPETMRPGDTMYFLGRRGRIRHTAIYLGDDLYLHAQLPTVMISSLDPQHPAYDARRHASFAFAKRLMD